MVNGVAQNSVTRRGLRNQNLVAGPFLNRYPADVWNTNNAARNVLEIVANEARDDVGGDYKIRIYTIGMGDLIRYDVGTMPEQPETILKRISNDATSPEYNASARRQILLRPNSSWPLRSKGFRTRFCA